MCKSIPKFSINYIRDACYDVCATMYWLNIVWMHVSINNKQVHVNYRLTFIDKRAACDP